MSRRSITQPMRRLRRPIAVAAFAGALPLALLSTGVEAAPPADGRQVDEHATATGTGGAVASESGEAAEAAMAILNQGGNAVDAAVAAAAVQGVTRPFSGGVGGGGQAMIYTAEDDDVTTLGFRAMAPESFDEDTFLRPDGSLLPSDERVTSGASFGIPGTVQAWEKMLSDHGTMSFRRVLNPAIKVARRGFVADANFVREVAEERSRFADFPATRDVYLNEDGSVPEIGSIVRNRDLAKTYNLIANKGADAFYSGKAAKAIADTVNNPPLDPASDRYVRPGDLDPSELSDFEVIERKPTRVDYRGYEIYGPRPPSSGGALIGEVFNILEGFQQGSLPREEALHNYLESTRLGFADHAAYLGDPRTSDIPVDGLLSKGFATERRRAIDETAATGEVLAGNPHPYNADPDRPAPAPDAPPEPFRYDFDGADGDFWDGTRMLVSTPDRVVVDQQDEAGRIVLPAEEFAHVRAKAQMDAMEDSELQTSVRTDDLGDDRRLRLWLRADEWASSTTPSTGYGLELRSGDDSVRILRRADGDLTEIGQFERPRTTEWEQVRFRVDGSDVSAKLWPKGTSEPTEWEVQVRDDAVTGKGRFLLGALEFDEEGGGSFSMGDIVVTPVSAKAAGNARTAVDRATPVASDPEDEPPAPEPSEDVSQTIHLSVSDADGNIVSLTHTIVSIGGNGMVVPGYGFLLNDALYGRTPYSSPPWHPNAPKAGMRPLSSMSPTIVFKDGEPVVALGAPGSATILTTVSQVLLNHLDFDMSLPEAIAAPRASQRNSSTGNTVAESEFLDTPEAAALRARGHTFYESTLEQGIGAVNAIAFLPNGQVQAASEPVRRGGGSAMVEHPSEEVNE